MHMVFRISIRYFLRTQELFKDIAKQLVNWVCRNRTNEGKIYKFQIFPSLFEISGFHMIFVWNSKIFLPFFWNLIWSFFGIPIFSLTIRNFIWLFFGIPNFFLHFLEFNMKFFWNSNFFPHYSEFRNFIWFLFGISYIWSKPD